jgi:uncharacterized membrane protein
MFALPFKFRNSTGLPLNMHNIICRCSMMGLVMWSLLYHLIFNDLRVAFVTHDSKVSVLLNGAHTIEET